MDTEIRRDQLTDAEKWLGEGDAVNAAKTALQVAHIALDELDKANEQYSSGFKRGQDQLEAVRAERDAALAEVERLKAIEKAAEALRKCWADGTFDTMWMSHMVTLRSALDARKPDDPPPHSP
jgi:hypothetical protein